MFSGFFLLLLTPACGYEWFRTWLVSNILHTPAALNRTTAKSTMIHFVQPSTVALTKPPSSLRVLSFRFPDHRQHPESLPGKINMWNTMGQTPAAFGASAPEVYLIHCYNGTAATLANPCALFEFLFSLA